MMLSMVLIYGIKWSVAGYLQDIVYKLSKVGQFIDNNDLSAASSVLGGSTDTDWVKKANIAFTKVKAIIYVPDVFCILVACCCSSWRNPLLPLMPLPSPR